MTITRILLRVHPSGDPTRCGQSIFDCTSDHHTGPGSLQDSHDFLGVTRRNYGICPRGPLGHFSLARDDYNFFPCCLPPRAVRPWYFLRTFPHAQRFWRCRKIIAGGIKQQQWTWVCETSDLCRCVISLMIVGNARCFADITRIALPLSEVFLLVCWFPTLSPSPLCRRVFEDQASDDRFVFPVVRGVQQTACARLGGEPTSCSQPDCTPTLANPLLDQRVSAVRKEPTSCRQPDCLVDVFCTYQGKTRGFLDFLVSWICRDFRSAGVTRHKKSALSAEQIPVPADLRTGFPR